MQAILQPQWMLRNHMKKYDAVHEYLITSSQSEQNSDSELWEPEKQLLFILSV